VRETKNFLRFDGLDFSYPKGKPLFHNFNWEVPLEGTVALLGDNGTGKTTLLKIAAGLLEWQRGKVETSFSRVGMIFQNAGLFDSWSVEENLLFVLKEIGIEPLSERVRLSSDALREVGLLGSEKKRISELSGGMKKRLGIARAFLGDPDVLLCDDPTAGLDPVTSRSIITLLESKKSTLPLILATTDLGVALQICQTFCLLEEGKLIYSGNAIGLKQFLREKENIA
jgi:phospholipid/cholesterol/gamma-HCH transport system ATP-binding protein